MEGVSATELFKNPEIFSYVKKELLKGRSVYRIRRSVIKRFGTVPDSGSFRSYLAQRMFDLRTPEERRNEYLEQYRPED